MNFLPAETHQPPLSFPVAQTRDQISAGVCHSHYDLPHVIGNKHVEFYIQLESMLSTRPHYIP